MENFAELFESSPSQSNIHQGQMVDATILKVDNKFVTVNTGLKSDSIISIEEFTNERHEVEAQVGDIVKVVVELLEDGYGETKLSRDKAKRILAWDELEQALEKEEALIGYAYGRVKGGLGVTYKGIRLFLPGSLLDVRPVRDFMPFEGKDIEFKVIKIDKKRNNIVISRRAVVADRYQEDNKAILERMQEGNVVSGVVKNITDYGAFVDLGGIDGLLYITDLSWKRVKHPSEVLTIDDTIEAKVLKFDEEKQRVSLGLKQMTQDPWLNIEERYPIGARVRGKISNVTDYGAFVELEDAVEGLVHLSEMDWSNKSVVPSKLVNKGDEVEVQVLSLDVDKRRISLGMKQCAPNPWLDFSSQYHIGDSVVGTIRSITDFGIFVGLPSGIDGLVHVSDLSWVTPGDVAIASYKKGDEITVMILSVDIERERIALGVKQLDKDPYSLFLTNHQRGAQLQAVVTSVTPTEAIVQVAEGVEATLTAREVSAEKIDDLNSILTVGDNINVALVYIDRRNQIIHVSMRALANKDYASSNRFTTQQGAGMSNNHGDAAYENDADITNHETITSSSKKQNKSQSTTNHTNSSGTTSFGALLQDRLSQE